MANRATTWFKRLSKKGKIFVVAGATFIGLTAISAASPAPSPSTNPSASPEPIVNSSPQTPITETKNETTQEQIPFTSKVINDPGMLTGTSKVTTTGVNGTKSQNWKVTYIDGKETSRTLVSETVAVAPVEQVTSNGTKAPPTIEVNCPNGSYINSAGNTVCRPHESSSSPAGATARCSDGTYSYSQSRRGTCSHHGGVATWL